MIQRIQSVWLLLASIFAFATLQFSFYSGNKMINEVKTFVPTNGLSGLLLTVTTILVAVISLVSIFLYKNRKQQLWFSIAAICISLLNIFLCFRKTFTYIANEGSMDLSSIIYFLIPALLLFAAIGIYKDEKLVKSMDRLR